MRTVWTEEEVMNACDLNPWRDFAYARLKQAEDQQKTAGCKAPFTPVALGLQTGKTTYALVQAIAKATMGETVYIVTTRDNQAEFVRNRLKEMLNACGLTAIVDNIQVYTTATLPKQPWVISDP